MKSVIVVLVLLSLFSGSVLAQLADSPWPMFMHDAQHTGRSPYSGPQEPNLAWSRKASYSEPVIGPNGIIYAWSYTEGQIALRLDGTASWRQPGSSIQAVGEDNTLYYSSRDTVYALYSDGSVKWTYKTDGWMPYLLLDATGSIFVNDGINLTSLSKNGAFNWQYAIKSDAFVYNPRFRPVLGLDGKIYIRDADGLKAIDADNGSLKWTSQIYVTSGKPTNSISVGYDGTIYVGNEATFSDDPILRAINPDGSKKWELKPIPDEDIGIYRGVRSPAAIGTNSTIYFGENQNFNDYGYFYAVGLDGKIRWSYKTWKGFPGSPIIDASGIIYAVSGNGELFAFNPDGTIKWQYPIQKPWGENDSESYPAIDSLGTLYVAAGEWGNAKLCAFFNIDPAHTPDLSLLSNSISFEPLSGSAASGTQVKIRVPIKETSGAQSAAFDVIFYADELSNPIDSVRAYAPPNFTTIVEGTWDTEGFKGKTYQIFALVKNAYPDESSTLNNQAQATYELLPSLQERIDLAEVGDTVWVSPGTYYENLSLKNNVVVKSTKGPKVTIIDGRQRESVITADHLDPTAVLDGFTITNGKAKSFGGGGVYIERGGVTIRNCIIRGNDASNGGAIWMIGSFVEADPVIENNLIIDNHASFDGGAVYANNSWALFRNNTVINNSSSFSDKTGGIHTVGFYSPSPTIVNCIIWGNGINLGGTASAIYSCIEGGGTGAGNISSDPMFVDAANGDYHLQADSPCIDAGDPASPRDPDGTRSDMGWKYFDQSATIAQIKGRLTDATTGAPVKMAKVILHGPRTDIVPPNANGEYVFSVPAGTGYCVRVFAPNYKAAEKCNLPARIGEATIVDFALTPYPTEITLFPPTELNCAYLGDKVHLSWQRPKDELAFDDGFYEQAVGFLNSQGILAVGPFKPKTYPAKIENIKVAFDGERAGDNIELMIYLDETGSAAEPSSSQLVYSQPNIPIQVGGGFQDIDVTGEGLTLYDGSFFIGVKQVAADPMYMLLDDTAADGHSFLDGDLDGEFADLSSQNIHGTLAIRAIVSMPSADGLAASKKTLIPLTTAPAIDSLRILALQNNLPVGLTSRSIIKSKSAAISEAEHKTSLFSATPPQATYIYRSISSPVALTDSNKIATLAATATVYDDMNPIKGERNYYVVGARYPDGTVAFSEEVNVYIPPNLVHEKNQQLPNKYELAQNFPNPFNPTTTINYQLPVDAQVTLKVYNSKGQQVTTLLNENKKAGRHSVSWNAMQNPTGVYFTLMKAGDFSQARKMLLLR